MALPRRDLSVWLLLAAVFLLFSGCTQQPLEEASRSYKLHKDSVSLTVIHQHLARGIPRPVVEELLGEADYSPVEGQYYYLANQKETAAEASLGLVVDYRDGQGKLTDVLQHFWLGGIGE